MLGKEIQITEYELENCNGNLSQLSSAWTSVPMVDSSKIRESKGQTADGVKECLDLTKQVSASLQALLYNSTGFFKSLGIVFREADEAASQHIDSLTK